jgi:hypothetical protein
LSFVSFSFFGHMFVFLYRCTIFCLSCLDIFCLSYTSTMLILLSTNFTLITFLNFEPFKLIEFFNLNKTAPTAWI